MRVNAIRENQATPGHHYTEHDIEITAGHDRVYGLIAEVTRWPLLFPPCVHVEIIDCGPGTDRFRIWAVAGETVRSWTSRRRLDETARRIDFDQENSKPPLAAMGGHWRIESSRLVLAHHWALRDPTPEIERWVTGALDRNSDSEIAAVKNWAERVTGLDELAFGSTEEVAIAAPAPLVYDFLHRSDLWPDRLPHVSDVALESTSASDLTGDVEVQTMVMETKAPDETVHTTHSVRLCFPHERIVYKQTTVPRPLLAHSGDWTLIPEPGGVRVLARHHFILDPEAIAEFFGAGTSLADAGTKVREALGRNSLLTLEQARKHVESTVETR
jgi:aromatase